MWYSQVCVTSLHMLSGVFMLWWHTYAQSPKRQITGNIVSFWVLNLCPFESISNGKRAHNCQCLKENYVLLGTPLVPFCNPCSDYVQGRFLRTIPILEIELVFPFYPMHLYSTIQLLHFGLLFLKNGCHSNTLKFVGSASPEQEPRHGLVESCVEWEVVSGKTLLLFKQKPPGKEP